MGSGYHRPGWLAAPALPGVRDGSFSPDGAEAGLFTHRWRHPDRDLATGEDLPVPGTANGDFNPIWSPDGAQISTAAWASSISSSSTWMARTCARSPTAGCRSGRWAGWRMAVSSTVPGRVRVHRLPPRPRQRRKPGVLEREHPIPHPMASTWLSPGLAFGERWQIDISRLDGADRWALANDSLWVLNPLWSASGEWLLATVSATDSGSTTGALINLRTCGHLPAAPRRQPPRLEAVRFPSLQGLGQRWAFCAHRYFTLVGSVI